MSDPAEFTPPPGYKLVAEGDLNLLQKSYGLFSKLWDDPTYGAPMKQAVKKIDPTVRIPEIDVAEPLLAPIREELEQARTQNKTLEERFAALETSREEEKQLADLEKKLAKAQRDHRLTDEGMAEVKKIMIEKGVADPEIAAGYVVKNIEPLKPMTGTNYGPQEANVFGMDGTSDDEMTKLLHTNPDKFLDVEVGNIMREVEAAA